MLGPSDRGRGLTRHTDIVFLSIVSAVCETGAPLVKVSPSTEIRVCGTRTSVSVNQCPGCVVPRLLAPEVIIHDSVFRQTNAHCATRIAARNMESFVLPPSYCGHDHRIGIRLRLHS